MMHTLLAVCHELSHAHAMHSTKLVQNGFVTKFVCLVFFFLFFTAHVELFRMLSWSAGLQFLAWVGFPVIFMVFSAGFVHLVSANAIGKQTNVNIHIWIPLTYVGLI